MHTRRHAIFVVCTRVCRPQLAFEVVCSSSSNLYETYRFASFTALSCWSIPTLSGACVRARVCERVFALDSVSSQSAMLLTSSANHFMWFIKLIMIGAAVTFRLWLRVQHVSERRRWWRQLRRAHSCVYSFMLRIWQRITYMCTVCPLQAHHSQTHDPLLYIDEKEMFFFPPMHCFFLFFFRSVLIGNNWTQ